MTTKLKGLQITSTDLVDQGANPDAHIRLLKRKDNANGGDTNDTLIQKITAAIAKMFNKDTLTVTEPVEKGALTFVDNLEMEHLRELSHEMFECCYAFSDSLCSIICDGEMDCDGKRDIMFTSLDEFTEAVRNAVPKWAQGKRNDTDTVAKSAAGTAAFDTFWGEIQKAANGGNTNPDNSDKPDTSSKPTDDNGSINKSTTTTEKEETDTMKIDKSKLNAEEQAVLADLEKKYGVEEPETPPAPPATGDGGVEKGLLHPEVQKAIADIQEINKALIAKVEEQGKSLEMSQLTSVAKKYEIIGKKADELAPKLYELKKAGGTVYDDYVALLNEQATLVEKSGIFAEIGKNTSGGAGVREAIGIAAADIAKNTADGLSTPDSVVKAWEANPELAAQYDKEYKGGN